VQDHSFSIEVEATPTEVWQVFWSHRSGRRRHGDVTIEILLPGDEHGLGLVRHCTFPVPGYLLSGGTGVSWEWISEMEPGVSWRYDAVGKPLWSKASGWTRLEDMGDGRTRIHFRETYDAFNPVLRVLLERRVHHRISKGNDRHLASAIEAGVRALREKAGDGQAVPPRPSPRAAPGSVQESGAGGAG
jgi:hypothetical protein